MNDTISRQAAIEALGEEPEVWTGRDEYAQGLNNQWHYDVNALKALPSAQPTLYGYDIKDLAFIVGIMAKEGVTPEEAAVIFKDVNRLVELMLKSMTEEQVNALEQILKRPGGVKHNG